VRKEEGLMAGPRQSAGRGERVGQREQCAAGPAACWVGAARGKSRLGLALRKGRWASARLERGRKSDGLEKKWAARGGMTTARNRKEKGDLFFLLLFF